MIGYLIVADNVANPVEFRPIRPAGFRILEALSTAARELGLIIEITCGSNGHSILDPHTLGEAYDVRSHNFEPTEKILVLQSVMNSLLLNQSDSVVNASNGMATLNFFGFIEDPGTSNEHIHFQRRRGVQWPGQVAPILT